MSLLIYLTAKRTTIMLGVGGRIPVIALQGSVAVIYTSLGGLRAVIITDFMQTVLLYSGALLVLGTIADLGNLDWVPKLSGIRTGHAAVFSSDLSVQ